MESKDNETKDRRSHGTGEGTRGKLETSGEIKTEVKGCVKGRT